MQKLSSENLQPQQENWPSLMARAIAVAENVITATPNPRVGCVLVKNAEVIAQGWHAAAGQDHAEIMALKKAGDAAASATVFVSLEPCAHTGRTGPCCDALIAAGVAEVVVASIDPNPDVAGKGIAALEAVGIKVYHLADFDTRARALNPGYFKHRETGRPYVRCKLAMSLDGRTALANGESKWITSVEARADVQRLRARSSAVITGIETVLADDPSLNVRVDDLGLAIEALANNQLALAKPPLRVVLDSKLRIAATAKMLGLDGAVKVYALAGAGNSKDLPPNVEIIEDAGSAGSSRVNLNFVLESLASNFDCNELLVEAGATLSGEFIRLGLVDELVVYIAPKLLGNDARALLDIGGLQSMAESINFKLIDVTMIGGDIRATLKTI